MLYNTVCKGQPNNCCGRFVPVHLVTYSYFQGTELIFRTSNSVAWVHQHVYACTSTSVFLLVLASWVLMLHAYASCFPSFEARQILHHIRRLPAPYAGPYIASSIWEGNVISWSGDRDRPTVVHCRGVWGHAPPGKFENFRCSEAHSGAFWRIQRSARSFLRRG